MLLLLLVNEVASSADVSSNVDGLGRSSEDEATDSLMSQVAELQSCVADETSGDDELTKK